MTFGYVAAKHLANGKIRPVGPLPTLESGLTGGQKLAIGGSLLALLALLWQWRSRK